MSALDIREAKRSLIWWLRDWGVTDPERKANQFIDDMVDRGWIMSPARENRPQPPKVHEQCRRHAGQRADHCGGCAADKNAATYEDETEGERMDRQTAMDLARAALVAAKHSNDDEETTC